VKSVHETCKSDKKCYFIDIVSPEYLMNVEKTEWTQIFPTHTENFCAGDMIFLNEFLLSIHQILFLIDNICSSHTGTLVESIP